MKMIYVDASLGKSILGRMKRAQRKVSGVILLRGRIDVVRHNRRIGHVRTHRSQ